jgi:Pyruvate/2-oxoacid:ferredoxin oxidoreductase gamma subunit
MMNITAKLTSKSAEKIAVTAIKSASKVTTKVIETGVLTNPVTLTAAVAVTGIYATYKYLDNKDKRRYENKAY